MEKLPGIEQTDSKEKSFGLKWTIYSGRRKGYVNFKTDTHKLSIVVYRCRNRLNLNDNEIDLIMTEY